MKKTIQKGSFVSIPEWGGRKLFVPDRTVFPPSALGKFFSTTILSRYQSKIVNGHVLDIGTGSGILAVSAGLLGANHVTAIDLNKSALTAVTESWKLNGLDPEMLTARESNVFQSLTPGETFDVIVANPPVQPFIRTDPTHIQDRSDWIAWNEAEKDGRGVFDRILQEGPRWLSPNGVLLITTTSRYGDQETQKILRALQQQKRITSQNVIFTKEVQLDLAQYGEYISFWKNRGEETGDPRIFLQPDGTYTHRLHILEIFGVLQPSWHKM